MARFCPYCGTPVPEGSKFCVGCGKALKAPEVRPEAKPQTGRKAPEQAAPEKLPGISAPITAGEFEAGLLEGFRPEALAKGASGLRNPLQTLLAELRSAFGGLKALFTGRNLRGLLLAGTLALIWTLLLSLRQGGVNGPVRTVLDLLFFGQGGVSRSFPGILGGTLGKGAFAAAAASLLNGGWRSLGSGVKGLFDRRHFQKKRLPLFLLGAGLALAVYQLFAWRATYQDVMAAVSGALLALAALGGRSSLLRRLVLSLTARKDGTGRIARDGACGALLAGLAAGFGLGIPLSLTGFGLTPLIVGGAALIAALVLLIVFRRALLAGQALLLTLLLLGAALAEPVRVFASASEPTGYWEFVEIIEKQTESLTHVGYQYEETLSGSATTGFVNRRVLTCEGYRYDDMGEEYRFHKGSCKGEFTEAVITFSPLPGARLEPGEELAITANAACSTSAHTVGVNGQTFIEYRYTLDGQGYTYFRSEEPDALNYVFHPEFVWQYENPKYTSGGSRAVGDRTETYRATIPQGRPGRTEDLYIRFFIHIGSESISTYYHYRWVDTTQPPVTAAVTETPTAPPETEVPPAEGQEQDGTGPIETETTPWIVQVETHDADEVPGEDSEAVNIIPAIVTGLLGVGAALGGVLLGGGARDGGPEEKKQTAYRMKVYKNFGSGIRKGAKPVPVWARIVELIDGEELDRPELTEKITVSGEGMDACAAGMENSWRTALVSVQADAEREKAVLIFTYTGEGGVFHNRIVFQVLGAPEISFPAVSEDGLHWDVNRQNNQVNLIAGAGGRERLRFVITNTAEEPKAIRFSEHAELEITLEKDPQWQFTYYACIENRTAPIEKESGIFASPAQISVRIEADFEDGTTIWSLFPIRLFPEGLAAQGKLKDGRLVLNTAPWESVSEGVMKFIPAEVSLTLTFLDGDGRTVAVDEPRFRLEKLTDDGRYGLLFTDNFDYELKYPAVNRIDIWPKQTLPCLDEGYEARLPLLAEEAGQRFQADLPLLVTGEEPKRVPMDEQQEYAVRMLRKDIRFFGLDKNPELRRLVETAVNGRLSADDINQVRKRVIEAGVAFYQQEKLVNESFDRLCSRYILVAGTLVYAGDKAVEYILELKFGKFGNLAAYIVNPLKNLLATYVGEYIASGNLDQAPDFLKTLLDSCDEALSACINAAFFGSAELPTEEIKKVLGSVMATYILFRFVHHYNEGSASVKGDIFRSTAAACGDLTFDLLKAFIVDRLMKAASAVTEKLVKWFGDICQKFSQGKINDAVMRAGEKAFGDKIKAGRKAEGQISTATYRAAKTAKALAKRDAFVEGVRKFDYSNAAKSAVTAQEWFLDNEYVGTILYNFFGRKPSEGFKATTIKDYLVDYVQDSLGLKAEKYYETKMANPLQVVLKRDRGCIILGMLNYQVEILMTPENLLAIGEAAFESLFSWLDAVWDMLKQNVVAPDPRKLCEKNVERIRQELEEQKRRMENLEDVRFRYTGK